jgi:lactobin A/cerein 7B family class IIb bacteriocin
MTTSNMEAAEHGVRELTAREIDEVNGGIFPILVMAFAVGFDIGFCTTMYLKD